MIDFCLTRSFSAFTQWSGEKKVATDAVMLLIGLLESGDRSDFYSLGGFFYSPGWSFVHFYFLFEIFFLEIGVFYLFWWIFYTPEMRLLESGDRWDFYSFMGIIYSPVLCSFFTFFFFSGNCCVLFILLFFFSQEIRVIYVVNVFISWSDTTYSGPIIFQSRADLCLIESACLYRSHWHPVDCVQQ